MLLMYAFTGGASLKFKRFFVAESDCDDIWRGGPDWLDGQLHSDDFQALASECHQHRQEQTSNMEGAKPIDLSKNVFVHVGKCGGTSVRMALRSVHIDFNEIHVRVVQGCSLDSPRNWIVSVRNPIDRAVSAFNWRSPRNAGQGGSTHASTQEIEEKFYACFATVNQFAEALGDGSACGALARKMLNEHVAHLGMGLEFYFASDLECMLTQSVYLVRVETWASDVGDVTRLLGAAQEPLHEHVHSDYPMGNQTYLSDKGQSLLSQALRREYEILRELELKAENGRLDAAGLSERASVQSNLPPAS